MGLVYAIVLSLCLTLGAVAPAAGQGSPVHPIVGSYSRITGAGRLAARSGPGSTHPVVLRIHKGAVVAILSGPHGRGGWYEVSYRGRIGYAPGKDLAHTGLAGARIARRHDAVIVISLARQQVEVYERGRLLWVSSATTGRPELPTPAGTTRVTAKLSPYRFVSPWPKGHRHYYVPSWSDYALRFRPGYYIHNAPWRPYHGYGTDVEHKDPDGVVRTGSHGCVNVPYWAMQRLYAWADAGTVVAVVPD